MRYRAMGQTPTAHTTAYCCQDHQAHNEVQKTCSPLPDTRCLRVERDVTRDLEGLHVVCIITQRVSGARQHSRACLPLASATNSRPEGKVGCGNTRTVVNSTTTLYLSAVHKIQVETWKEIEKTNWQALSIVSCGDAVRGWVS